MPDQPPSLSYRIKGFPPAIENDAPIDRTKSSSSAEQVAEPKELMGQVFRSMRRPHLSDVLYHFDGLNQLSRRWPTFNYLNPRRKHVAIKSTPLHLAPYLSWVPPYDAEGVVEQILQASDQQETEQKSIQGFLYCLDEGETPELHECPLATALACHLFGGSAWFRAHRARIHEIVLQSPEASFVALSSGAFPRENDALLERVAVEPRFVLELAQSPVHRPQLQGDWFGEALKPHPLFHSVWLFTTGRERAALTLLRSAAESDPIAAGVCLGLELDEEQSANWMKLAMTNGEAIHWHGKVWFESHDDLGMLPHASAIAASLAQDRRWAYHWLRDLEWDDLPYKVGALWPHPWAVEVIVDRHLSKEVVSNLCSLRQLDPKHPIESAVLLWAADYVTL